MQKHALLVRTLPFFGTVFGRFYFIFFGQGFFLHVDQSTCCFQVLQVLSSTSLLRSQLDGDETVLCRPVWAAEVGLFRGTRRGFVGKKGREVRGWEEASPGAVYHVQQPYLGQPGC